MKKLLMTMLLVMIAATSFSKTNFLSVVSGDISVLNQSGKTAIDEFDYSNTNIEGKLAMEYLKSHGADYLKDWPNDNVETEKYFYDKWNDEIGKGVKLVRASAADYKIVVHIDYLDLGNTGAALFSLSKTGGGCIIGGSIDIIANKTGNIVCKLTINSLKGNGAKFFDTGTNEIRRRGLAYEKLAKQIIELAKNK